MKAEREPGFVLVGVVMLVLALTILGLSLFSLSSYEAQFLGGSLDGEQSFQAAQGGIERAKYALSIAPNHLEQVANGLPLEHVTAVVAEQEQGGEIKNSGPIDFGSDKPIKIKVTTEFGNDPDPNQRQKRMVEGEFLATKPESYYRRLITSGDSIDVRTHVNYDGPSTELRKDMVYLSGGPRINFWQESPDTADWTENVGGYDPHGVERRDAILPPPLQPGYFDTHLSLGGAPPRVVSPGYVDVTLGGAAGAVTYYRTSSSPDGTTTFSYHEDDKLRIHVGGPVVWMADRGFKAENLTTVSKLPGAAEPACLVIVSRENRNETFHPDAGVWFFGGLHSENVPVILVSDGAVIIEHFNNFLPISNPDASIVNNLAIYADHVILTGPRQGPQTVPMQLRHTNAVMDDIIDFLSDQDALPGATPAKVNFTLVPGSWRAYRP